MATIYTKSGLTARFFLGGRGIAERTAARSCLLIHERMKAQPMTSISALSLATKLTPTTTDTSLAKLAKIEMVREITGSRYGRLYAYDGYLKILAPYE